MSTDGKLSKLVITRFKNKLFAISYDERDAFEIEYIEESSLLGSIHIGKVKKITKNINAAFVEIEFKGKRQIVYLDLSEFKYIIFADDREHSALHEGDDILIKISRLPIKTKLAAATAKLKITDENILKSILLKKNYIKAPAMLYSMPDEYIEIINERRQYCDFDILTDEKDVYNNIVNYFNEISPEYTENIRLYDDKMITLSKLYSIETLFNEALEKKVWLKGGGYLIIESTEALTVIDVNTGKNISKKEESKLKLITNLEALKESARQLRLRNISGIIIIDLINTTDKSEIDLMFHTMKEYLKKDRLNAVAIDITKLCLFEITRRKKKPGLFEVMGRK